MFPSSQKFLKHDDIPPVVEECVLLGQLQLGSKSEEEKKEVESYILNNDVDIDPDDGERHLYIRTLAGKTIQIRLDSKDTIMILKRKIQKKEGISIDQQRIIFTGKQCEDKKTIEECGMQNGSIIHLVLLLRAGCFLPEAPIKLFDGSTKPIKDLKDGELVMTYNIETNRLESSRASSVSVFQMDYLCEIDIGHGHEKIICTPNHPLWVPNKQEWRAVSPHPNSNLQVLSIGDNVLTSDLKTPDIHGIKMMKLSLIDVYGMYIESAHCFFAYGALVHNMQIFVRTQTPKTLTLDVVPSDSILTIKEKIMKESNIVPQKQQITFAGTTLEDNKTLSDYHISKETTLQLVTVGLDDAGTEGPESEYTVNINCLGTTYSLSALPSMSILDLKKSVSSLVGLPTDEISVLYGGRIILKEELTLATCNVTNNSDIIVIPGSEGGNCLRLMQIIQDTIVRDLLHLKSSLSFLQDQQKLNEFFINAPVAIQSIKQTPQLQSYPNDELLAVMLWTTNILYKQVNEALAKNSDLSNWSVYLKKLIAGLKHMPYHRGKVYRGIKNYRSLDVYKKGAKVNWKTISVLSKAQDVAKSFTNEAGTLFEVDVVSARNVSKLSVSPSQEEVVLLPYSCLEVVDVIDIPNQPLFVKLREIPTPRAPKVVFWVDDNPEYNYKYAHYLEEKGLSCVFCTSTKDALSVIDNYRWLLYFEKSDFRIVTDMVRYEDGVPNYTAGLDLLKALFQNYKYTFEVLIFCNDEQRARDNAEKANLQGSFIVTSQESKLLDFINFQK